MARLDMRTFKRKNLTNRRTWHGSAFIMEALALLFFMVACMAVLLMLLSTAFQRTDLAEQTGNAVILATNEAETFAAHPTRVDAVTYYELVDGQLVKVESETESCYVVKNNVLPTSSSAGTMYEDDIEVLRNGETVYEITTSRYMSDGGAS